MNSVPVPVGIPEAEVSEVRIALSLAMPLAPDLAPRELRTQAAYRMLITNGIAGAEAAALIGYVVGLAPAASRWNLSQINRLLFLRDLYSNTEWGESERLPA
jgi:enoyl-CoA hydratase/carnithine racemase